MADISENIKKTVRYLKRNGVSKTAVAVAERVSRSKQNNQYDYVPISREELREQRKKKFEYEPRISIVVPAYETNPEFMYQLLESVWAQTYKKWELILADASKGDVVKNTLNEFLEDVLDGEGEYANGGRIDRIVYRRLDENRGISQNTNEAVSLATGEYIGLLDHDDMLTPDALFRVVSCIQHRDPILIYSDEDKVSSDGKHFFEPNRKRKFNLDLFLTNNYICHFAVINAKVMKKLLLRGEFDGAQDYDLFLRIEEVAEKVVREDYRRVAQLLDENIGPASMTEELREKIVHIPRILYHWRSHRGSTSTNTNSKMYAYEAGKRAIEDFCKNKGWNVTVNHTSHLGFYRVEYKPDVFLNRPEIGVIVGPVIKNGKIISGAIREDSTVVYQGLVAGFSGYLHRASLVQESYAGDVRRMVVSPEIQSLYDEIVVPFLEKEGGHTNREIIEFSLDFCDEVRRQGYAVLYDPQF